MNKEIISKFQVQFATRNPEELERIYQDIFEGQEYAIAPTSDPIRIIDCGTHVGVGVAFFKSLAPKAQIVAVEPNPATFALLQQNIALNHWKDVQAVNAAVSLTSGPTSLFISRDQDQPWSWGDSLVKNDWYDDKTTTQVDVPSVTLSSLLEQPVDVLKLDVEGVETKVLQEASSQLAQVKQIYIEFHGSSANPDNKLGQIVEILHNAGYEFTFKEKGQLVNLANVSTDDPQWVIIHAFRS